ncbi:hypothetical protein JMA_03710 [Jeotgalibacillus malaysiensis]|uniref:Major facilitator superfamily (MFS) profile domain-containing protein n=1 Tax=Jeotgalibacillus malaysiensis TaxID=1508404 RepID=A0A0B5AM99_9BACL|nr:hypothetical protein JMA_03710 [Jeotgalibacillus malaysiensis]
MFIILLFSTMPFIGVMVTNYLFPVYLADVLETSGSMYGIQSMIYAIGAVTAGMIVPFIAAKWGVGKTIIYCMVIYTAAISVILFANIPLYLALMFFIAIGNSGTRVARNTFMMDQIPNEIIGRVDGLFRSIGLLLRIVLLAIFTGMVSVGLIIYCFAILSTLLVVSSLLVILFWKKGIKSAGIQTDQYVTVA